MTPGRLEVNNEGRVWGPAKFTYQDPWPDPNGTPGGGAATMLGVVMHTEVGNNPGTEAWFDNTASHASAFFAVAQDGTIAQNGPIGKNWMAWAQGAGNPDWYSIEHADNGDPKNPLTKEQVIASAQLVELLSRFANFPLKVTDSVYDRGYGEHSMGGVPWGDHPDCPGPVRAAQRAEIVSLAKEIRVGVTPAPAHVPPPLPKPELEGILVALPGGMARKVLSHDGGKTWA